MLRNTEQTTADETRGLTEDECTYIQVKEKKTLSIEIHHWKGNHKTKSDIISYT